MSILALCAALAGCSMMPDYQRPELPVPAQWPQLPHVTGTSNSGTLEWSAFFADPRLEALIAAALENNRDMRIAVARVKEARALYGISRADRLPALNLAASRSAALTPGDLSLTGRSLNSQRYDAGLSMLSYELDFWGRVKSLNDAAMAAYLASEEARRAFRLSLIADVANSYLQLEEMDERIVLTIEVLKSREETRAMIARRREVGIAGDLDYLQADGALELVRAELANLFRQRANAESSLTLLVGQPPANLPAAKPLSQQVWITSLAVELPSTVLLNRPDVLAAEQRLIAANANIGAARAAFLPRIGLTAVFGTASARLAGLFDSGSGAWNFQPVLSQPLFDAGRIAANADLAEVRKVIAVAEYEKTIQQAFKEVVDLLTAREKLAEQLKAQEAAEKTQTDRLKIAEARYKAGISSYLEVLDAQREAFSAQHNSIQIRRALLASAAQLYKALGGGG
jgi:multidrug efflux system outer membrane protein